MKEHNENDLCDEANIRKLKEYTVKEGEGIFRIFGSLGLNNREMLNDVYLKIKKDLEDGKDPVGIRSGDIFILDTGFNLHIRRSDCFIKHYELITIPEKILEKEELEESSSSKLINLMAELENGGDFSLDAFDLQIEKDCDENKTQQEKISEGNNDSVLSRKSKEQLKFCSTGKEFSSYIRKINPSFLPNLKHVIEQAYEFSINPGLLLAVMQNDTGLGKHLYAKNNFGNIGITEEVVRNKKKGIAYKTPKEGIRAVAKNLRERINAYDKHNRGTMPTVREIMTGISRTGERFFGKYMTDRQGPKNVEFIFHQIASR